MQAFSNFQWFFLGQFVSLTAELVEEKILMLLFYVCAPHFLPQEINCTRLPIITFK